MWRSPRTVCRSGHKPFGPIGRGGPDVLRQVIWPQSRGKQRKGDSGVRPPHLDELPGNGGAPTQRVLLRVKASVRGNVNHRKRRLRQIGTPASGGKW